MKEENLSTYAITATNFENTVVIDGVAEPVHSTTLVCPRNVDAIITFLIDDGTVVNEGDVLCILEDNNRKTEHDNLVIQLETAEAELSKVKADLQMQYALLEAQVKNNEADTEIAHLDSLQLQFATPTQRRIKDLELERALIEKNKFEKKLEALNVINQSEVRKLELNIQQLTNRLASAKTILDGLTLRAPRNGLAIVANSRMMWGMKLKVGDNVWSNMPIVIIPEVSEMKVKMMASETDFRQITENDSVSFSFDAMPNNTAYGKITKKLPVGQPYKEGSKVKFFEVEASVDSALQLPESGLTANCRVYLQQVPDTIVVPQIAIFDEDSLKVVYVRKNKKYEMRQIATGLSSHKESIVSGGLRHGEVIALIKPPPSMIRGKTLLNDSTTTTQ
ncbi:MAG: hypothetical protein Q4G48_05130 [Bacteroidia bacterium]|nr:hypothetical protein [Bacteroidia bacterium]